MKTVKIISLLFLMLIVALCFIDGLYFVGAWDNGNNHHLPFTLVNYFYFLLVMLGWILVIVVPILLCIGIGFKISEIAND
jgi:hypothetical protein